MADEPTFRSGPADSRARSASAKDRLATLFPDPDDPANRRHWYQRRGRLAVACLVVVALVAGTAVVAGAVGSTSPDYRTAVVGTHLVDQQLTGVATIEPISQATVAFPVSGTVSTVGVKTGDTVTVGQTLASLDTAALTVTLHTQEAALAQAQLVLANALAGKTTSSTGASGGSSSGAGASAATASATTTTPVIQNATLSVTGNPVARSVAAPGVTAPGTTGDSTSGTSGTPDAAQISAAQQAVLAAQKNVDAAIAAANTALASAATICSAAGISTTSATHPTATTTPPATTAATGTTASPSTTPTPEQLQACQTATKTVLTDQTAVSAAQTALATASSALDALLSQAASGSGTPAATTTAPPATSGGGSTSRSGGTTGGGTGGGTSGGGATSTAPSAADLVKYQAAVDAAEARVAVAQQAIDQATIASPISGTVAAVNMKAGDPVTSNSSTENVVIEGHGGYEVSTTVSVTDVPEVKVGQAATVLPDGSTHPLAGTVSSISVAPAASASTTSYMVFVGLTDANANLLNGATGTVSIVTGRAASVLAVPTSAVTTNGTRHTVSVVNGGKATTTAVQVGVVGDTWTEIKSGVRAGETLALANLAEALPGSATTATTSSTATRLAGAGGLTIGNFAGAGRFPGGATP